MFAGTGLSVTLPSSISILTRCPGLIPSFRRICTGMTTCPFVPTLAYCATLPASNSLRYWASSSASR